MAAFRDTTRAAPHVVSRSEVEASSCTGSSNKFRDGRP